jgi:phosphohistidine phosphatase
MILLFLRHGKAEIPSPGEPDAARRLTSRGKEGNRLVLAAVRRAGALPDAIVHSPLIRAAQTGQAAGEVLEPRGGVHADDRLACGAELREVQEIVADYPAKTLMLVGHNPDFAVIVGQLVGGAEVDLKTSGVACVSLPVVEAGAGQLEWLIKPSLFADER